MIAITLALAGPVATESVTCTFRGVSVEVRWTAAGEVSLWQEAERLTTFEVGSLNGMTSGRCAPEGVRLLTDHRDGGFSVSFLDLDLGEMLDTMPSRFDASVKQTDAGVAAAARADWAGVSRAIAAGADRAALLDAVLANADTPDALDAARVALPELPELARERARQHLADGRPDQAAALVSDDPLLEAEAHWAAGRKGPARKVWTEAAAAGIALPPDVLERCPRCSR